MSGIFIIQFLVLFAVVFGVTTFFLKKTLFDSTQGAVNRLNQEMETVRAKQKELNEKIEQANQELAKRRAEADELVNKMREEAYEKAMEEREAIIQKARKEADEIITKAQATRDNIRKALEQQMDLKAVDFALLMLQEVLGAQALRRLHKDLIEDFLNGLKEVDMSVIEPSVTEAEMTTGQPLSEEEQERFRSLLTQRLGRPITIQTHVDKTLMAGVILKLGTLYLKGSLRDLLSDKAVDIKDRIEKGLLKLEQAG